MYEVCFADDRKELVSGPNVAFGNRAQLNSLSVGSCVVVEHDDRDQVPRFSIGILAEVPNNKNKQRLVLFTGEFSKVTRKKNV